MQCHWRLVLLAFLEMRKQRSSKQIYGCELKCQINKAKAIQKPGIMMSKILVHTEIGLPKTVRYQFCEKSDTTHMFT